MIPPFLDKSKIPHKPGVYQFKNKAGDIIYVGKALDLLNRVSSYFSNSHLSSGNVKTAALVEEIAGVDTIIVSSELEALILEANLIKKYLPYYNIRLTDDKDYLYIKITTEKFPKIITARKKDLNNSLKYFGPFPSTTTVKNTLRALRRVFPWCQTGILSSRPCFYYHLGLCPGVCTGEISQKEYKKMFSRFIKFMEGKKEQLILELIKDMQKFASTQNFELAAKLKRTIAGINYLTQANRVHIYLDNPNFLQDQNKLALEKLQQALSLDKIPNRIEGYDISNIQGTDATGSMVVLTNGEIDKSQYRKFKIKISGKPNDVAMMAEMLKRRLKHLEWQLPDLIIVDGGKGQVTACRRQFEKQFEISVFGLAKRMEWLYSVDGKIIKLSRSNPALKLVQKLRDEAHRFALTYHRKLHQKTLLQNMVS